jgi:trehalose-6-phosphate hydrolase
MQWDNTPFAGFSKVKPWIKVHENYHHLNVAFLEKQHKSLLNKYRKLIALRNAEPVFQYGGYDELSMVNNCISITREYRGNRVKCYFNFSEIPIEISLNPNEKVLEGKTTLLPNGYLFVKISK